MSEQGGYEGYFRPSPTPGSAARELPPELDPRRPAAHRARPAGRATRALSWIAGLTALGVMATAGIGWAALTFYDGKINRIDVGLAAGPPKPGAPMNILLVGSDSRAGLTDAEKNRLSTGFEETKRSDTMIVMHVSADNQDVTLISFPRDSYVTIPAHTSEDGREIAESRNKINAAYAFGGPALTIDTIELNTGMQIDHYVEVDIAGFVRVVDAVGGASVCLTRDVDDKDSGLKLSAGEHKLDGEQALAYVRARKIYTDSDLGRIRAQQAFIGSLAREALSADTLANPVRLNRLLTASLDSLTTDEGFTRESILRLADRLRETKASQIRFVTVPVSDIDYRVAGVGSAVLWDEEQARDIFDRIINDQPIVDPKPETTGPKATVAPGKIKVQVLNGTDVAGLGARAADDLADVGFGMAGLAKNADSTSTVTTVIRHDPEYTESLKSLQAAIPGATTQAVEGLGATFEVIVGTDWKGASKVTVAVAKPTTKPSTTPGVDSSTTAAKQTCT